MDMMGWVMDTMVTVELHLCMDLMYWAALRGPGHLYGYGFKPLGYKGRTMGHMTTTAHQVACPV